VIFILKYEVLGGTGVGPGHIQGFRLGITTLGRGTGLIVASAVRVIADDELTNPTIETARAVTLMI